MRRLAIALLVTSMATTASAFSFNITTTPQQCQTLNISITGTGEPPYRAVFLPVGSSPLPGGTEVRSVLDLPFDGDSTNLSFRFAYPSNSLFVVTVSDSSGFGSGGTSSAVQVQSSNDDTCYAKIEVKPPTWFAIEPENQLVQCTKTRIWWDPAYVQGTPQFYGVIPGGQSFQIQQGSTSQKPSQGTGFDWSVPVREGTMLLIVGGDNRGIGSAGRTTQTVQRGTSGINNSCLDDSSPSSTPGSPAGGSFPTSLNGTSSGNSSGGGHSSNHTGAIVGGVVGGLAILVALLLCLFFIRRERFQSKECTSVDLLHGDSVPVYGPPNGFIDIPQSYQPEPLIFRDTTIYSPSRVYRSDGADSEGWRPLSHQTSSDLVMPGTPGSHGLEMSSNGSSYMRGSLLVLEPPNIIQHDDGGPEVEQRRMIELPPAYINIRNPVGGASTSARYADVTL